MWFGTSEGLNKFDGTNFTLYVNNPNDSNSLVSNNINALFEDKHHNLWIGTTMGICVYNREKDNFKVFKGIGRNTFSYISSFIEDKHGNIWIGSSGQGIHVYNPDNDSLYTYIHDDHDPASVSTNYISCISSDKHNRIWFGTHYGLDLFDVETGRFIHFKSDSKHAAKLKNNHVKRLCFDHDENLWVGTYGNGLFKITEQNTGWQIQHYTAADSPGRLSSNDILSLICDNKGNLWIGTENGGLNYLSVNSDNFRVNKTEDGNLQGISSNSIWSVYQDTIGIIWIGTYNHGLNFIDENINKFEVYQRNPFESKTLTNNNVTGFYEDNSENLWIATDGGGICNFNMHTRKFTNVLDNSLLSSNATMDVLYDSKHRIWVATWGGGIDLYDNSGKKIKNFRLEAYNRPGSIFCLMEDNSGNIWAGTARNGLLLYDPVHNTFNKVVDSSGNTQLSDDAFVITLFQDSENTIWVGVSFSLISIRNINGERVFKAYKHTTSPQSLSSFDIATIFEDSKNNIWIGTDDGLNLLNKESGTFRVYRKEDGLPNNTINGILEDDNYCLWLSTHGGISKFDIEKETFKNYSIDDGLLSNSFNPRACIKAKRGELFFGNNNGFISFFPDRIKSNTYIPPVYFTDFKTFNTPAVIGAEGSPLSKSIGETKQITLNHEQTSFIIEFVALNFTHPAKTRYAYMLEGFDKEWIYTDNEPYATYTNIDAGKYTFKVMGSNNEGIWNPDPIELEITVLPPLWKTTWAYLFYITCIVLIFWGFIKLLIIRANQAEKLRLEQIHHERSEELNRMKIRFFANISHEFRTPLSLILAPLKEIISQNSFENKIKSRLDIIFRNANKLFGLVNELMDFTKSNEGRLKMKVQKVDLIQFIKEVYNMFIEEAGRHNIQYKFESLTNKLDAWIDKSKMEKIISNLLSNAFKFTQDNGHITLKIHREIINGHPYATISITDNGSGISPEYIDKIFDRFYQSPEEENDNITGTGIGLALVKSLVELHHG
ncbi:MAG: two-component regulator propeller domain-containing protein, partial [Bacteroidales bacterium]